MKPWEKNEQAKAACGMTFMALVPMLELSREILTSMPEEPESLS